MEGAGVSEAIKRLTLPWPPHPTHPLTTQGDNPYSETARCLGGPGVVPGQGHALRSPENCFLFIPESTEREGSPGPSGPLRVLEGTHSTHLDTPSGLTHWVTGKILSSGWPGAEEGSQALRGEQGSGGSSVDWATGSGGPHPADDSGRIPEGKTGCVELMGARAGKDHSTGPPCRFWSRARGHRRQRLCLLKRGSWLTAGPLGRWLFTRDHWRPGRAGSQQRQAILR